MGLHDGSSFRQVQAHLGDARSRLNAGEFDAALEMVDRALDIDPEYLAARALREKIAAAKLAPPPLELALRDAPGEPGSPLSLDNFAKLEARVRHRGVEHRLKSARAAIRAGQFSDARAAICEASDLDPDCPEAGLVALELEQAEDAARSSRSRGPWFAAAITFAAVVLCAAGLFESNSVISKLSRAPIPAAPTPLRPAPIEVMPAIQLDTLDDAALPAVTAPAAAPERAPEVSAPAPVTDVRPASGPIAPISSPIAPSAPPAAPIEVPAPTPLVSDPPAALPPAVPLQPTDIPQQPIAASAPSEDWLVRNTLQRYRSAYEGLDAKSAQQVWPTVDEPALARAFDGLESQSLTFDDCAIELHGVLATATCRGSTSYTPRTGSREPRVEPRVWNFTLAKIRADWQIESARVAR